jgi:hypothetical protein
MDIKKLLSVAILALLVVLFVLANLYKGAAPGDGDIFSASNIIKTVAFFLLGAVVVAVVHFLRKKK